MSEKLTIHSIETDNRITVEFSDKYLPRHARHGELFVVNGILYIFADLNDNNQGKWFPLTNEKQIFTYSTNVESEIWEIPIDFQTNNIQVIVYDDLGRIYPYNFDVNITEKKVTIIFDRPTMGEVYLIINTAFDWVDRRFIVGNKNFAVTEDTTDPDVYFIEIDTKYVEILKNGNVTFRSDVIIEGSTTFIGDQSLDGNVSIGGDIVVQGSITSINKLIASSDATIEGDLDIQGKTTINKSLIVNESTLIEANLDVNGITILNDDTTINGNLNLSGDANINGSSTITTDLTVMGTTILHGSLDVGTSVLVKGDNHIIGNSVTDGDVVVGGNLIVKGATTTINTEELQLADNIISLNSNEIGNPTQNAGLEVKRGLEENKIIIQWDETNDVTNIPNNTEIDGNLILKKGLDIKGPVLLEETLTVSGITTLNDDLNFNTTSTGITWNILDSEASVKFYKDETVDTPRRLEFQVANEDNEFFSWVNAGIEKMTLKSGILDVSEGITINGKDISLNDHNHDTLYLGLIGGTISGNVIINGTMSATEIIETSSIRFKENVKPIEHAYETISKLQGVTYNWKETGKEDIGFIAEEVDKILPQLVDKNEDGIVNGMNYSKLTALLVEVVKNQQKQIDELKKLIK